MIQPFHPKRTGSILSEPITRAEFQTELFSPKDVKLQQNAYQEVMHYETQTVRGRA